MTNKERITAYIGFSPANPLAVEAALVDQGLVGADTYTIDAENVLSIKKATVAVLRIILTTADTVNENGYSIKWDRPSLLKLLAGLEEEISPAVAPRIRGLKPW